MTLEKLAPKMGKRLLSDCNSTIRKVFQSLGNYQSRESYRSLAEAAVWIVGSENPKASTPVIYTKAKSLFETWVLEDYYTDEKKIELMLQLKTRRRPLPLHLQNGAIEPRVESERTCLDNMADKEELGKSLFRVLDRLMLEWGAQAMAWAAVSLSQKEYLQSILTNMGYSQEQIKSKEFMTRLKQIERGIKRMFQDGSSWLQVPQFG